MGVRILKDKNKIQSETKLGKQKKLRLLLLLLPTPLIISLTAYLLGAESTTIIAISSLGLILIIGPFLAINFLTFREIKNAEEEYPNFLRDIAQNVSAGMTLPQAISTSADSNYGALTKYIRKLNIWLSWNTPFPKAWTKFTKLLTRSDLIKRINNIILESFHAGGEIKVTLNSLADDVNLLKQMEFEKKSVMKEQIIIMYAVYFVFVGVIIGLFRILAPILFIQKMGVFSGITVQNAGGELTIEYFKNLFFLMILVESICAGIIAGQISEERLIAGFRHVVIMLSVGVFFFFIFIFPSQLNLDATIYPSRVVAEDNIIINGQVFYESAPASGATVTVITPQKQVLTMFVDNLGEFERTITAPMQKGAYSIIISVDFKNEKQTLTRTFEVI
jgi:archaeal flagellar protein FlaJ